MNDTLSISIGNSKIDGWKTYTVSRSLRSICGDFSIQLTNVNDSITDSIKPQLDCEVFLGSDQLLKGTIFKRIRSESKGSTNLEISGRDITAALVDCSAITNKSYWENATIGRILKDICKPFGIVVKTDATKTLQSFSIQSGESAADTIQRVCRQDGLIAYTNRKGELVVKTILKLAGEGFKLSRPGNIKTISEDEDFTDSYSEIFVKSQEPGDGNAWTRKQLQQVAKAKDKNVKLYRPKVILSDSRATKAQLQQRANWEMQYRAGMRRTYAVTVKGFRQTTQEAELLELGLQTTLSHDTWNINEQRLISDIAYSRSVTSGSLTQMTLSHPSTFLSNPTDSIDLK